MQALNFEKANILLTGGTGEIGHGFLKALSVRSPSKVFIPSSSDTNLNDLKSLFPKLQIEPVLCDLANENGIDKLIQSIKNQVKSLDLVIFGAGMLGVNGQETFPKWDNGLKALALNALSPDFCFYKLMTENLLKLGGTVIALGSIAGHKAYLDSQNLASYTLSKAALSQAVKNWAKNHPEMTIFEIALGAVQTKMLDACRPPDMSQEEWQEALMHDIPIKEIGQPDIVAETIIRLLEAPGYRLFHGDTIHLSGGERNF